MSAAKTAKMLMGLANLLQFALLHVGAANNQSDAAWIDVRQPRLNPRFLQDGQCGLRGERGRPQRLPGDVGGKSDFADFRADIRRVPLAARPLHDAKGSLTVEQGG